MNINLKYVMHGLLCELPPTPVEMTHLIIDCVVHSLVLMYSNDPFVHHKRWLHCNNIGALKKSVCGNHNRTIL